MAQPIIVDPTRREMRARAAAAPWEFAAGAILAGTQSIERILFDAQQRKEQEKERRLGVMGTMLSMYDPEKLGPDFALQWERDTGVKLPRDDAGKPFIPPTTKQEVDRVVQPQVMKAIASDPNKAMVMAGLQKAPPSAEEQALMSRELDLKKYAADLAFAGDALRARATLASAGAKTRESNMPSGWVYDPSKPKGQQFEYVGFNAPSLSMGQLNGADKAVQANLGAMDFQKKELDIQMLSEQIRTRNADAVPKIVGIYQNYDKIPEEEKVKVDALIKTYADTYGIDVPVEKKEFRAWSKKVVLGLGGAGAGLLIGGPKGAAVGGVAGFLTGTAMDMMPGEVVAPVTTPTMRATGKTPEMAKQLSLMTDDDLRKALMNEVRAGAKKIDILEKTGNDMRVMQILSEIPGGM